MEKVFVSGLAGGCAGIVVDLIYFPIDTIKTRLQASNKHVDYYTKANHVSKYKGLLSSMTISFPAAFIFFFTYDQAKRKLKDTQMNLVFQHMIAASVGEISSNVFRNPFEVVKNQMQVGLDSTIRQTVKSIYGIQGIRGLYAGFLPILMREIPFSCIQFPIYEKMKKRCLRDKKYLSWTDNMVNGATAGGIAAFFTTPCDVVKSKLMTQRGQFYNGLIDCTSKIYKDEGFRGFFKASHYRTLQIATSGIIFFGAYEQVQKFISIKLQLD